jgi:hypothetical protein
MAEWDDAPLAGQLPATTPAPVQSDAGSSPWDAAPLAGPGPRAKAVVSANTNPEEAGKALSIAKQTGIPASIVQTDIPGYDAHAKTQAAIKAIENPAIASYIDKHPMAAQVSNDDYSVLDKISGFFTKLDPRAIDDAVSMGLAQGCPSGTSS